MEGLWSGTEPRRGISSDRRGMGSRSVEGIGASLKFADAGDGMSLKLDWVGDFMLDLRGGGGRSFVCCSSSSAMAASGRDDDGTTVAVSSFVNKAGLAENDDGLGAGKGTCRGVMLCSATRGDSARVMKDETSGGNAILLSLRSLASAIGEGRSALVVSTGEEGAELLPAGTSNEDAVIFSSRSELCRRITGGSGRSPNPTAEEELGMRFPLTGSSPADASILFARSRSVRNLSFSITSCVH